MPPRQITSYFQKLPATAAASAAATTSPKASGQTAARALSSSPKPTKSATSPLVRPAPTNSTHDESERPVKRAKTAAHPTTTIGTIGSAASSTIPASVKSRATTREELRTKLAADARRAELLRTEVDTMGEDWLLALQDELTKPYFLTLKEFITSQQASKKVFPPAQDVYSWSRLCPLQDVRVVIIGQDPYHDDGQAHGLAFSVRKGVRIPPSLRNIYKEMHDEVPSFTIPKHGDLTEWAKHGVLLLNTSLTVRAHEAGSHSNKGWETFTAAVLKVVTSRLAPDGSAGPGGKSATGPLDAMLRAASKAGAAMSEPGTDAKEKSEIASAASGADSAASQPTGAAGSTGGTGHVPGANGVCFMAWGAHAQKMCAGVDTKKHLVLKSVHPSPLAAMRGFFGNGHFVKANKWLEERYGAGGGIDWAALGEQH